MKRKRDWLNAVTLQTLGNGGDALQRFFRELTLSSPVLTTNEVRLVSTSKH